MRRRDFITSAALGTALTLLPPSLRRTLAFAGADCTEDEARIVARGLARAREDGKPLVVFVVPTSDSTSAERGSSLGMWIDLGSDRELAVLALAHVVCASLAAVHCVVPTVSSESDGEPPWMLVIDPDGGAPDTIRFEAPAPNWEACMKATRPEDGRVCFERETRRHCGLVAAPLRRALVGAGLARRARRNEAALGRELATRVRTGAADGGTALPLALVDRGAPLLLASTVARGSANTRPRTIARLAAAARLRLQAAPPPGARWLRLGDCATYAYSGLDDIVASIGCGMGNVGVRAARILHFLATR